MNDSKEVIHSLLSHNIPERMGIAESFWPELFSTRWKGSLGEGPIDESDEFSLDIRSTDFFEVPGPREDLVEVIDETEQWIVTRNAWGSVFKHWKHRAGTPEHIGFAVSSPEKWEQEFKPFLDSHRIIEGIDWDAKRAAYERSIQSSQFVTGSGLFVFEDLRRILGDLTMLESILLEPSWITDICTSLTDIYIHYFEHFFSEVGLPDGMHIYEDLGYTNNAFISPVAHRELIAPHHKRLFTFFKGFGLPIILHSCGDFRVHIESIIDSGVDCIQAMEAKTGMDVLDLARSYGDTLCFMGNIDIRVLETGDRGLIEKECVRKLEGMKALRSPYIFMSDHSIPPSVSYESYQFMQELFWEHCRY